MLNRLFKFVGGFELWGQGVQFHISVGRNCSDVKMRLTNLNLWCLADHDKGNNFVKRLQWLSAAYAQVCLSVFDAIAVVVKIDPQHMVCRQVCCAQVAYRLVNMPKPLSR